MRSELFTFKSFALLWVISCVYWTPSDTFQYWLFYWVSSPSGSSWLPGCWIWNMKISISFCLMMFSWTWLSCFHPLLAQSNPTLSRFMVKWRRHQNKKPIAGISWLAPSLVTAWPGIMYLQEEEKPTKLRSDGVTQSPQTTLSALSTT